MHVQLYNAAKCGRYFIDVLSIFQSSEKLSPPHFSAQFTSKAFFPSPLLFPFKLLGTCAMHLTLFLIAEFRELINTLERLGCD